jgi:hypothetical protein
MQDGKYKVDPEKIKKKTKADNPPQDYLKKAK